MDPKAVFPSPSDSFKSDAPLPCPELEEACSLGEGERSGGTTPRGDRPRDGSPKWLPPARKEEAQGQAVAAGADINLASSKCCLYIRHVFGFVTGIFSFFTHFIIYPLW